MTSQNQSEKDPKTLTTPTDKDDAAAKAAEPSAMKEELTDDELRAVAGGAAKDVKQFLL